MRPPRAPAAARTARRNRGAGRQAPGGGRRGRGAALLAAMSLAVVAGCSGSAGSAPVSTQQTVAETGCTKDRIDTVRDGHLTIATDDPAYAPWFIDNDPGNGQGYESGLGYRLAQHLGYDPSDVTWVRQPLASAVAPGGKPFDLALMEASVTDARRSAVDLSTPYHRLPQAVVTWNGSPIAGVTRMADLRGARLGAVTGTTSYDLIGAHVRPTTAPVRFADVGAAVKALDAHQVDGIVADLPTAVHLSTAVLEDATVLGRLPAGTEEHVGAVLPKRSPLTRCVDAAVAQLSADGTLRRLADQWLAARKDVPQLS